VYKTTGKRLAICLNSKGKESELALPPGLRPLALKGVALSFGLGGLSEKVTVPSGPTIRKMAWAWAIERLAHSSAGNTNNFNFKEKFKLQIIFIP
jgi:hypothetical protein